ncbi:MAG: hypothetical protein ACI82Z_000746 [Cellvibrionaceae bacterium]|jgi:hypothetical protein
MMTIQRFKSAVILSAIALGLLSACSSTMGPVSVSDREILPVQTQGPSRDSLVIAKVLPVVPDKEGKTLPLVEKLIDQANSALGGQQLNRAIEIAERGLRVDRKEDRLYLVLAQAYGLQNNLRQARHFAQQGLRYAEPNSDVYQKLKSWIE